MTKLENLALSSFLGHEKVSVILLPVPAALLGSGVEVDAGLVGQAAQHEGSEQLSV